MRSEHFRPGELLVGSLGRKYAVKRMHFCKLDLASADTFRQETFWNATKSKKILQDIQKSLPTKFRRISENWEISCAYAVIYPSEICSWGNEFGGLIGWKIILKDFCQRCSTKRVYGYSMLVSIAVNGELLTAGCCWLLLQVLVVVIFRS